MSVRLSIPVVRCLLCICLLVASQLGFAKEQLEPYEASYKLYKGGIFSARVSVSLQPRDQFWSWRTEIAPASWYSLFSNERSFNTTRFALNSAAPRISHIELGSSNKDEPFEVARFDWEANQMQTRRKGKSRQFALNQPVYDYQSIHLLALEMNRSGLDKQSVSFYRKGKLTTVTLHHEGTVVLDYGKTPQTTDLFTLSREGSDDLLKYFYAPGNLLYPIRIEHLEPDNSGSIMILQTSDP